MQIYRDDSDGAVRGSVLCKYMAANFPSDQVMSYEVVTGILCCLLVLKMGFCCEWKNFFVFHIQYGFKILGKLNMYFFYCPV